MNAPSIVQRIDDVLRFLRAFDEDNNVAHGQESVYIPPSQRGPALSSTCTRQESSRIRNLVAIRSRIARNKRAVASRARHERIKRVVAKIDDCLRMTSCA